ncbi:hypothetical protein [Weeksella virosa]|uniref:Uncharacterized protein n=1 Tax=Weeksella virosa (strain ATCC 43766 / DSM 16922 / JCM 21250 / CCUG 30538 / CDC 9751 / IAM 14551 / NBRC 16016 / NCTC 11634 / CL345/78) TaxID=865938 RepID=F0P2W4_WEEVC|nr:hypothetical protein [Weeksella virosa]ADX66854.1 hypothetical protein Weevi_0128 [Weeksella virosa DSM 16922]MDK7675084.1 hypothetical protein [Weeksella virosa]VEH63422.1 Uncharacterised protein [Weeksella virosa]
MAWKVKQHKEVRSSMDLNMSSKLKFLAETTGATTVDQLEEEFKKELLTIKRKNIFSAEYSYKMTQRNQTSAEVWKLKANGDFNYKIFTLDWDGAVYNPFNF